MKKLTVILMVAVSFLATHVLAGTLTVNGDLATATNLSAQSITLGGVMQTNWPSTSAVGAIDLTSTVLDFSQTALLYRVTLTNNISWAFTNHVAGRMAYLQITENSTGGWTNSWPAGVLWPDGIVIGGNVSSNSISVYEILDNGTSWLVQAEGINYGAQCSDCYALEFNGGNYLTVDQSSQWAPAKFTFEAWVNSSQGQPNGDWGALASTEEFGGDTAGWMAEFGSDGHFRFSGILQDATDFGVNGSAIINTGGWHHVAATYDGSNIVLYVDGQQDGSPTATDGSGLTATSQLNLGVLPGGWAYNYYGILDEVQISSVVRYTGSFTPVHHPTADSDTIALWTFSEGSGATAGDSTGNHTATLAGSPTPAWVGGR